MNSADGIPQDFARSSLEAVGYVGWQTWEELRSTQLTVVPRAPGCYVVHRPGTDDPTFLPANPGGRFKGKDPTIPPERMVAEWVPDATAVYIGKADDLRTRLKAYARFGAGDPVAHWGGRLIWQLADADKLLVAWCPISTTQPARDREKSLLARFAERHDGRRPFANLTG